MAKGYQLRTCPYCKEKFGVRDVVLNMRITKELRDSIQARAKKDDSTMNDVVFGVLLREFKD
jgi:NRPS condensation-like uncharacterized protein